MDLYKEPNIEEITPKIAYIFDFLEYVEAPFRYATFRVKLKNAIAFFQLPCFLLCEIWQIAIEL